MTNETEKTFVYDGTEVRKTGRRAKKDLQSPRGKTEIVICEITPADEMDGAWKKWVQDKELFTIVD